MNVIKIECSEEAYKLIPKNVRDELDIKSIAPKEWDYSDDLIWKGLKKESVKAYKKLKEWEFKLRHQ